MIDREAIYQALFDRVKSLPGLITVSRRPRLAKDVTPDEQPALFQEELPETIKYQSQGLPPKYFLRVDLIFYARLPDRNTIPGAVLNPFLDALAAALEAEPGEEEQTLGGQVEYCRIEGQIDKINGILDDQAAAIVPVEILTV
jgi:hypothetical protein